MLRSIAGKVVWVGRAAATALGLALVLALVFGVATTAIGATGGNFILGKANSAGTPTSLTASVAKPALTLINKSTDAAATALNINVAAGRPPLKVNASAGTATNLSADRLDGLNSSHFAQANTDGSALHAVSAGDADNLGGLAASDYQKRVSGQCPAGESIRSIGADGITVVCEPDDQGDGGTAQVNQLRTDLGTDDGNPNEASDPVSFSKVKDVPAGIVGRDADTIDGRDSTEFAASAHNHDDRYFTETEGDSRFVNGTEHTKAAHDSLNIDADTLDGKDSAVFAMGTEHSNQKASSCDTAGAHECAPVEIVVPTGKTYRVSVWSSANFSGYAPGGQQDVSYCSAYRNVGVFPNTTFCITPSSSSSGGNSSGNSLVTLPQDQFISVSSSGEKTLTAGTYMISTLIRPEKEFGPACCDDVITKVMVRDAAAPQLSGISRR